MNQSSAEERKKFAQEQLQFLKDQGVKGAERLSRIFKVAGPGQVKAAWELSQQPRTEIEKDLLDCVLTGACGSQDFGRNRMELVLTLAGFNIPKDISDNAFFRVLDGALEILVPGAYEFTEDEIKEIRERIQKKKDEYEQRQREKDM